MRQVRTLRQARVLQRLGRHSGGSCLNGFRLHDRAQAPATSFRCRNGLPETTTGCRFLNGFRLHDGPGLRYKFRCRNGLRDRLFGDRRRRFRLRHRFFRPDKRIEREHVAQVYDLCDSRNLLPDSIFRNSARSAEAHLIIDRPQFFERQIAFKGRNSVRLHPPFDERRKLLQFALYRFQIHSSIQF